MCLIHRHHHHQHHHHHHHLHKPHHQNNPRRQPKDEPTRVRKLTSAGAGGARLEYALDRDAGFLASLALFDAGSAAPTLRMALTAHERDGESPARSATA